MKHVLANCQTPTNRLTTVGWGRSVQSVDCLANSVSADSEARVGECSPKRRVRRTMTTSERPWPCSKRGMGGRRAYYCSAQARFKPPKIELLSARLQNCYESRQRSAACSGEMRQRAEAAEKEGYGLKSALKWINTSQQVVWGHFWVGSGRRWASFGSDFWVLLHRVKHF